MSKYLVVRGDSSNIVTRYRALIYLDEDKDYEMAFVGCEYNRFPNIIEGKNNIFMYSNDDGTTNKTII